MSSSSEPQLAATTFAGLDARRAQLLEARILGTGPCGVPTEPTPVVDELLDTMSTANDTVDDYNVDDDVAEQRPVVDERVTCDPCAPVDVNANTTSADELLHTVYQLPTPIHAGGTRVIDDGGLFSSVGANTGVVNAGPPPTNHSNHNVLPVNDCSNVSSAGSVSDKTDPETPDKSQSTPVVVAAAAHNATPMPSKDKKLSSTNKTAGSPRANRVVGKHPKSVSGAEKSAKSKRRRIDTDSLGDDAAVKPKTPKGPERKISEFLTKKEHPIHLLQQHHAAHQHQSQTCTNPSCMPANTTTGGALHPEMMTHIANVAADMVMERERYSTDSMPSTSNHGGGALATAYNHGGGALATAYNHGGGALATAYNYASGGSDSNESPPQPSTSRALLHAVDVVDGDMQTAITYSDHSADYSVDTLTKRNSEMLAMVDRLNAQGDARAALIDTQKDNLHKCRDMLKKLLVEQSKMERKQKRARCMENCLSLGQYKPERKNVHFEEVWYDGYSFDEVNQKLDAIATERNDMQTALTNLRKKRPVTSSAAQKRQPASASPDTALVNGVASSYAQPSTTTSVIAVKTETKTPSDEDVFAKPEPPKELSQKEYYEQDEIYRLRREQLKKEESDSQAELARLERERNVHIRELKRVQNEENSAFKNHAVLNDRYLLLSLLGKGGFSEVWHAFDLQDTKYVACKIHHVNRDWKEDKKANYVKHALREKDIHKTLSHARIVRLFDLFTIDNHSFCTVLEYCDGNDLDFYLKQNKTIPEKEARSIISQLVSALRYLNDIRPAIIHYDLKPANVLLSSGALPPPHLIPHRLTGTASGEIKITDFGLSKVMEDDKYDPEHGMDLTSQGAGTYWYLPPECFVIGQTPPKICSKVDVWSVGVIFYQCLYGKRPFGDGQTQASILENKTILNATDVTFASKPPVSPEAKAFIKRCLQYKKEERADVHELYAHEYLRPTRGMKVTPPTSLPYAPRHMQAQQQQPPPQS